MREFLKGYGKALVSLCDDVPWWPMLRGGAIGIAIAYACWGFGWIEQPSILGQLSGVALVMVVMFNIVVFRRIYLEWRQDSVARVQGDSVHRPPAIARKILWLTIPREVIDAAMGDMNEKYARLVREEGRRFAVTWYWAQTAGFCGAWLLRVAERVLRFIKVTGTLQ